MHYFRDLMLLEDHCMDFHLLICINQGIIIFILLWGWEGDSKSFNLTKCCVYPYLCLICQSEEGRVAAIYQTNYIYKICLRYCHFMVERKCVPLGKLKVSIALGYDVKMGSNADSCYSILLLSTYIIAWIANENKRKT